ncbi:MAG: VWA domain-containing protein [Acetobacteraceae bacterium]|nr:VWA domain-containing protein [Acetobacteraceae bacterium]
MSARSTRPPLRSRSGSVGVFAAMIGGVLIGIGTLALDQANLKYHGLLQRQTTQAAAMAAGAKISTYYSTGGSSAAVVAAAQTIAAANMPVGKYGNIVPAANVVLGNWDAVNAIFTPLAAGATNPDAVRVTGVSSAANGNPVPWLVARPGVSDRDYTTQAIASYGTGQTWNTIITNDLSGSFASAIASQRAADDAILNCVKTAAGSASQFGITTHTGVSAIFQPLSQASVNFAALSARIATMNSCGNSGAPACSGSNVASAIYSARQQFANAAYDNTRKNIIIITDGVPNGVNRTYTREDGIYPDDTATTPTCTVNCTDAQTWTMAINQATLARNAGISISTIYYSGNTPAAQRAAYAAQLGALVGGTGVAMVAPSTGQISGVFAGFCSTMSSALKAVY